MVTVAPETVALSEVLPARVSAFLVAEVRPQVTGIIQQRLFKEGADVNAGDALYQLDPALYEATLAAAKAAVTRAEAARASVQSRADRYKELVAIKAVSQQDYDDIVAQLKEAEAAVESAKAAADTARINLEYTRITAPIAGRIGMSSVTIGALATAYQPASLTTIQQLDPVYVDAPQASSTLLRLQKSMAAGNLSSNHADRAKVKLMLEDGTDYPQEGTLQFSDVTVDPGTGSYNLRMVFPNPDRILLPGMFVRAVVQQGVNPSGILVPQQAVARDPKGKPMAYVAGAADKVELRPLVLDRAIGDRWLVTSGLGAGDRVIVEGLQKVRPGINVRVAAPTSNRNPPAGGAQPPAGAAH